MSFQLYHELALQIYGFKNINMKQQGTYSMRFHIYYKDKQENKIILATPISLIESQNNKNNNKKLHGQIIDDYYLTCNFPIRYEEQKIILNQICIFRTQLDSVILNEGHPLYLYCQLMIIDTNIKDDYNLKKCGEFCAEIKKLQCHQFLEIIFEERYASVVTGAIHSSIYKCQFKSNQQRVLRIRSSNQQKKAKYHIQNIKDYKQQVAIYRNINQYLKNTPKQHSEELFQYFTQYIKQHLKIVQSQFRKYIRIYQQKSKQSNLNIVNDFKKCLLEEQKQRKKIFQSNSERFFQQKMHKLGNRIYHIWGNLLRILPEITDCFLPKLQQQYRKQIREKWGQNIVRNLIKTQDWTVDKYSNSGENHLLLAKKLRSLNFQQNSDLSIIDKDMFPDQKTKPIFFQDIYLKPNFSQELNPLKSAGRHLIILVHGFGACRFDMQKISNQIKINYSQIQCLIATSNEGRTDGDINLMGQRLSKQVINYIQQMHKQPNKISFIGHSMGGVIIRTALPKLQAYSSKFYSFITLSSPHAGYLYNSSKLIDAGLWIINNLQKCQSIQQLTMQDNNKIQDTFIYRLSFYNGLEWFKHIALFSSYQDSYAPFQSVRIQKTQQTLYDQKIGNFKGKIYNQMIDNIINRIKADKLYRIDVNFEIPQQNIDNLIGRTAHIKFLSCKYLLKMFITRLQEFFI